MAWSDKARQAAKLARTPSGSSKFAPVSSSKYGAGGTERARILRKKARQQLWGGYEFKGVDKKFKRVTKKFK